MNDFWLLTALACRNVVFVEVLDEYVCIFLEPICGLNLLSRNSALLYVLAPYVNPSPITLPEFQFVFSFKAFSLQLLPKIVYVCGKRWRDYDSVLGDS